MSNIVDRDTANDLIKKCRTACEAIFKEAGFEMVKSRGTFGDRLDVSFSAIPTATNELGLNPNSPQVIDFHRCHRMFELHEKALGVSFTVGKSTYRLTGLAPSRSKYPLMVETADGEKKLLTTDPRVVAAINQAAEALVVPAAVPAADSSAPAPAAPKKKASTPRA